MTEGRKRTKDEVKSEMTEDERCVCEGNIRNEGEESETEGQRGRQKMKVKKWDYRENSESGRIARDKKEQVTEVKPDREREEPDGRKETPSMR